MTTASLVGAVFGQTGRGDYGHGHDVCLNLHPNVRIESVADPDPAGREAAVGCVPGSRSCADTGPIRRLSKDYEGLPETSETWIQIAMIDRMLHRLGPA